jgi:hypothetical protein
MLLEPTIQLRAIRVRRGGGLAYSADFHTGVNILRGKNASGKSTIMDFIFYALGGEDVPWKNEALLCDEVLVEVLLNDSAVCLRRYVNENQRNPMSIFWGELHAASQAGFDAWETYPYQRSPSKESFSQVLFRALKLPELRGEGAANITMHQLLRLMYADQRTPNDEIFRSEGFETELNRETIGSYLCGVYSSDLYEAQIELKQVDAKLDRAVSDLRNVFSVLGKSGQAGSSTMDFLQAEAAAIQEEMAQSESKLTELREARTSVVEGESAKRIAALRKQLNSAQAELVASQTKLAELELEVQDSRLFVAEIDRRLAALDDSATARTYLGSLRFSFCPCCLSAVSEDPIAGKCHLCKGELQAHAGDAQILRMRNELSLQRRESASLIDMRVGEIEALGRAVPEIRNSLRRLESEYSALASAWSTPQEAGIEATARKLGELNQRLAQIAEYQKLATVLEDLQRKRAELENRKSVLLDQIQALLNQNEDLKRQAKLAIAQELIALLRKDLPRQEEFISAAAVDWSFSKNRVAVNGNTQFSESSMVILRHSFHLALLLASAKHAFFRFPRFLMLDGIEDGGQEQERSFSFQRLIVSTCASLQNDFQIIYATSQIEPSLETPDLVVGKASSTEDKTLSINV